MRFRSYILIGIAIISILLILIIVFGLMKHEQIGFSTQTDVHSEITPPEVVISEVIEENPTPNIKGFKQSEKTESVKIFYPKVVITKKEIKFLDENGNVKKSVRLLETTPGQSWSNVVKSKNENYIAINNVYKYAQKGEWIEDAEVTVLNDEGEELWKVKHNLADVIPSPNGKYIVGIVDPAIGDAPIYVFNEKGLIKEIVKDDQAWNMDFSKDGSFFAVTVITFDKTKKGIEKYKGHLIVIDEKGNELWRRENIATGESSFFQVAISEDNIISLITGLPERKVYRFDKQGNPIQK